MATRSYVVDFFQATTSSDVPRSCVADFLASRVGAREPAVASIGNYDHEIRNLAAHGRGRSFTGVFAKYRRVDLPTAGVPGGRERALDLLENEGLIEKGHFLYVAKHQVLAYHRNQYGSGADRFGNFLSSVSGATIAFAPILHPDSMRRLMRGDLQPVGVEIAVARPQNPAQFNRNDWTPSLFEIMSETGAMKIRMHLSRDARSRNPETRFLRKIKPALRALAGRDDIETLKADLEDANGKVSTIDLLQDRIRETVEVEREGGTYPSMSGMISALQGAYDRQRENILAVIGDGN